MGLCNPEDENKKVELILSLFSSLKKEGKSRVIKEILTTPDNNNDIEIST